MKRNPMTGLNSFFEDFFTKDLFNWNEKKPYRNGLYHAFCKRERNRNPLRN